MTEPLSTRLARKKAERAALRERLAAAKPHSAKRTLVSHQLMRITADVLRMEQKINRGDVR